MSRNIIFSYFSIDILARLYVYFNSEHCRGSDDPRFEGMSIDTDFSPMDENRPADESRNVLITDRSETKGY